MQNYHYKTFLLSIVLFFTFRPLYSEKVITAKEGEPDSYFGLKVNAIVTPTYGFRIRDKSSGRDNSKKDDRTGFSLPWTLLMISKEWEEKKIFVEFWTEVFRASTFSSDTQADNGNKANPYMLGIRRANIQKYWNFQDLEIRLIFGIQELPHLYTQWSGYWDWRYIDRAPLESLGFSPAPADLGISTILKYQALSAHVGIVNGEGYREIQNVNSMGYDFVSRISFEKEKEKLKYGIHFLTRLGNFIGLSDVECKEGNSSCVPNDKNPQTSIVKDIRTQRTETLGLETNVKIDRFLNFGSGGIYRRKYGGYSFDRLNQGAYGVYEKDSFGKAVYGWLALGWESFTLGFRHEYGTGNNGVFSTIQQDQKEIFNRIKNQNIGTSINIIELGSPTYQSKSYFIRKLFFIEYVNNSDLRFAISGSHLINYDSLGEKEQIYIDYLGNERTKQEYLSQFQSSSSQGIVKYLKIEKNIFFRMSIDF